MVKWTLKYFIRSLFCDKWRCKKSIKTYVESHRNYCLHRDVITLREQGNSDHGNPTFSAVSVGSTIIVSQSLQGNTGGGERHAKTYPEQPGLTKPVVGETLRPLLYGLQNSPKLYPNPWFWSWLRLKYWIVSQIPTVYLWITQISYILDHIIPLWRKRNLFFCIWIELRWASLRVHSCEVDGWAHSILVCRWMARR